MKLVDCAKLCERFSMERSFDFCTDADILETVIGFAGCRNSATVAESLLDTFGSLKGVFEARPEALLNVPGVNAKTAGMVSMIIPLVRKWSELANSDPKRINNASVASDYCKRMLAGARDEEIWIICLNAQCQVVGKRKISEGTLSECGAYPRKIVETALNYNAHSVLMTHNHPGGTCAPSAEDVSSTLQIQRTLNALNILLLDHIIVAGDRTYSMIQHGDIDYRRR